MARKTGRRSKPDSRDKRSAKVNDRSGDHKPRNERDERTKDKGRWDDRYDRSRSGDNDISWYTRYPQLSVAAASFPYPYRPGMQLPVCVNSNNIVYEYNIPGIMALRWMPSFGNSSTGVDPATVVAKELYARVRKAYSGSLECDGPDIFMYVGALDSVFSYIAYLKRIYRLLTAWTPENYQLPDTLLNAIGVSKPESLRAERITLYQYINELILQSRKFTCPAIMDLFNRHYWMSDNVYTDAATINSQMYVFTPLALYKFAELNMPGTTDPASGLKMVAVPKGAVTAASLYQFGLGLINALVEWDTAYTINGYLSRAFEGVPTFAVDDLPIDQPFSPVYSEEVLVQIENSMTLPRGFNSADLSGMNVTQNVTTNVVNSKPHLNFNAQSALGDYSPAQWNTGFWKLNAMISQRVDVPTVAQNIIATRLKSHITSITVDTAKNSLVAYIEAGTEIAIDWTIFQIGVDSRLFETIDYREANTQTYTDVEAFDWHPIGWILVSVGGKQRVYCLGDVHNVTAITPTDLQNLHKICLYSELSAFSIL